MGFFERMRNLVDRILGRNSYTQEEQATAYIPETTTRSWASLTEEERAGIMAQERKEEETKKWLISNCTRAIKNIERLNNMVDIVIKYNRDPEGFFKYKSIDELKQMQSDLGREYIRVQKKEQIDRALWAGEKPAGWTDRDLMRAQERDDR